MSIAIDQKRLRRIVEALLPGASLEHREASTMLQFVQLAAGVDHEDQPDEHSIMQSIAQKIGALSGLRPGDVLPIPPIEEQHARLHWLRTLGAQLTTRETRELTYAFVFLVSVADLQLTSRERAALEEFQGALGLDDRRAMDLVVFLTDIVAGSDGVVGHHRAAARASQRWEA